MRNRDRIAPFCEKLQAAWERNPDMRFGQFVCNVFGQIQRDPFYVEDDECMRLIEQFSKQCSPYHPAEEGE